MNCEVCQKYFTGIVPFQQHESSEKHKKRVLLCKASSYPSFTCTICLKTFDTLALYQEHVNSLEHAHMVKIKVADNSNDEIEDNIINQILQDTKGNDSKDSGTYAECPQASIKDGHFPKLNAVDDIVTKETVENYNCELCSKHFSGPVPFSQHMESETHIKKLKVENFHCDICNKHFSGPIPYEQHLKSSNHLKKSAVFPSIYQNFQKNTSMNSENSFELPVDLNQACGSSADCQRMQTESSIDGCLSLRCDTCSMKFTGPAPLKQHLESKNHKKKVDLAARITPIISSDNVVDLTDAPVDKPSIAGEKDNDAILNINVEVQTCHSKSESTYEETNCDLQNNVSNDSISDEDLDAWSRRLDITIFTPETVVQFN